MSNTDEKGRVATLLNSRAFETVSVFAMSRHISYRIALNQIVREWSERVEIEPLKIVPQTSHLDSLADKVDEIDSALDKVLEKLRTTRL